MHGSKPDVPETLVFTVPESWFIFILFFRYRRFMSARRFPDHSVRGHLKRSGIAGAGNLDCADSYSAFAQ